MTKEATAKKPKEDIDPWSKYEQRKAELADQELSPAEYQAACQRIADELGI